MLLCPLNRVCVAVVKRLAILKVNNKMASLFFTDRKILIFQSKVWFHEIRLIWCSFPWFWVLINEFALFLCGYRQWERDILRQQPAYNSGSNAFDPKEKDLLGDDLRPSKDASLENFWDRKFSKIFDLIFFHFHTFSNENFEFFEIKKIENFRSQNFSFSYNFQWKNRKFFDLDFRFFEENFRFWGKFFGTQKFSIRKFLKDVTLVLINET